MSSCPSFPLPLTPIPPHSQLYKNSNNKTYVCRFRRRNGGGEEGKYEKNMIFFIFIFYFTYGFEEKTFRPYPPPSSPVKFFFILVKISLFAINLTLLP